MTEPSDIILHIRGAYERLSKGQQRVAQLLLTRRTDAIALSAARLAELAEVSPSTVVRMAQDLGFSGFPELQAALREAYARQMDVVDRVQLTTAELSELHERQGADSDGAIVQWLARTDIAQIEQLAQTLPVEDLRRAAALLVESQRVWIVGLRGAAALAFTLHHGLRYFRPQVQLLQPGLGDLPDQLVDLGPGDLLGSFSFSPYVQATQTCMDVARTRGTTVIAITDDPLGPPARRAQLALVTPLRPGFYLASAAPFTLVAALLNAVAVRRVPEGAERSAQLQQLFNAFDLHEGRPGSAASAPDPER